MKITSNKRDLLDGAIRLLRATRTVLRATDRANRAERRRLAAEDVGQKTNEGSEQKAKAAKMMLHTSGVDKQLIKHVASSLTSRGMGSVSSRVFQNL